MNDHSIFGEMQCFSPDPTNSAGARTAKSVPCHGLFGTRLFPDEERKATERGISPDELSQSLS
jgi:hypothetical protein